MRFLDFMDRVWLVTASTGLFFMWPAVAILMLLGVGKEVCRYCGDSYPMLDGQLRCSCCGADYLKHLRGAK